MIRLGEPLAWVYVILMWVTVGNGLRYGNRYLRVAVALAACSFRLRARVQPVLGAEPRLLDRLADRPGRGAAGLSGCCAR